MAKHPDGAEGRRQAEGGTGRSADFNSSGDGFEFNFFPHAQAPSIRYKN
ncbi:MAG: hypothetical protein LAN83_18080 [Acidobacteriia bacterium]|nr:hypothetical protein [Terriglobia bacterium]